MNKILIGVHSERHASWAMQTKTAGVGKAALGQCLSAEATWCRRLFPVTECILFRRSQPWGHSWGNGEHGGCCHACPICGHWSRERWGCLDENPAGKWRISGNYHNECCLVRRVFCYMEWRGERTVFWLCRSLVTDFIFKQMAHVPVVKAFPNENNWKLKWIDFKLGSWCTVALIIPACAQS